MASNQFIARKGIISLDNAQITGSLSVTDNISSNTLTVTSGITGTATSASYVEYSNVAGKPALVSGSSQISFNGITDKPTLVSGSEQVSFNGIVDKPTLVSGSSQVTYSGLTGIPAGIVSGSSQISFNGITDKPTLVSGSSQITYSGISSIPAGIVSSSTQITGYNLFATTGSNQFNGSQAITGSLTVTGQVVAQTLNVQQVTSSIVFSSGSNIFGNSLSNTQQFTGSLQVSGSSHYVLGNVGIGTTSPSRTFQVNGYISAFDGTTNTEIISSGGVGYFGTSTNHPLALQTNNAERIRITSGGNVGIGTTAPQSNLQVLGTIKVATGNAQGILGLGEANGTTVNVGLWRGAANAPTTDGNFLNLGGYEGIVFAVGAAAIGSQTERMRITSGGNVGIGTTSPDRKLGILVSPSSTGDDGINITNGSSSFILTRTGSSYTYRGVPANAGMIYSGANLAFLSDGTNTTFHNGNGETMRITSGGNVGIGTTSPSVGLEVSGASNVTSRIRAAKTSSGTIEIGADRDTFGSPYISAITNSNLDFFTNDTHRMRITSGGNVGIGTTSPTNGLLQIYGTSGNMLSLQKLGGAAAVIFGDASTNYGLIESINGGGLTFWTGNGSLTERMRITSGGNVGIGTTNPATAGGGITGLDIRGTNGGSIVLGTTSTLLSYIYANNTGLQLQTTESKPILFIPNGTEAMRITSGGNVGIGTTSPSQLLEIKGTAPFYSVYNMSGEGGIKFRNDGGTTMWNFVHNNSDGNFYFKEAVNSLVPLTLTYATGRVGIGTTSPTREMVLYRSSGEVHFKLANGTTGESVTDGFDMAIDSSGGAYLINRENQPMHFFTNGAEQMRITSDGYLRMASGTGGIQFNGDTAAANALDDYEEGTWTPTVADESTGGNLATLSADSQGVYTKIGRVVYFRFSVILTSKASMTAGNTLFVRGFPFQSQTIPGNWYRPNATIIRNITFTGYVQFNQGSGSTAGWFRENISNANGDDITVSDLTDSAAMQVSGFYFI